MLPAKEYEVGHYVKVTADKYGKIKIDKKLYSTSPRYARRNVLVRVTYNRIEVLDDNYRIVVVHDRLYNEKKGFDGMAAILVANGKKAHGTQIHQFL